MPNHSDRDTLGDPPRHVLAIAPDAIDLEGPIHLTLRH